MPSKTMNVILFESEPRHWVAQCLEYDIGAQADSLPNLLYEFQRSLVGHVAIAYLHDQEPFECLPAAPPEYWTMFREQNMAAIKPQKIPFRAPRGAKPHPSVEPSYHLMAA